MAQNEVELGRRTLKLLERIANGFEHHNRLTIEVERAKLGVDAPTRLFDDIGARQLVVNNFHQEGHHDEHTLNKVAELFRKHGFSAGEVQDVIADFDNNGILFRER